jgi:hypothetical protein
MEEYEGYLRGMKGLRGMRGQEAQRYTSFIVLYLKSTSIQW